MNENSSEIDPPSTTATAKASSDRPTEAAVLRFGSFELDLRAAQLRKAGVLLRVHSQPLKLLELLARRSGQLVTREEIRDHLWPPGTHVEVDQGINACIRQVRAALGDSATSPRFVETMPRHGYRFLAPATVGEPASGEAGSIAPKRPVAGFPGGMLAITLLLGLALGGLWLLRSGTPAAAPAPSEVDRPVLVILPFDNLGDEPEQDGLAAGFTEELISQLGGRYPYELAVIARTSAMTYRETSKGIDEIAAELGADYVLESSIRSEGSRLRITAQLIDAADQSHLWAQSYDRELEDLLDLQREISNRIAASLVRELLAAKPDPGPEPPPDAYLAYLKGRAALEANTPGQTVQAKALFQEAVDRAPDFAPAYVGLARAEGILRLPNRHDSLNRIHGPLDRALELDPGLAEAHLARSTVALLLDFDLPASQAAIDRALELNPTLAEALHQRASVESARGLHDQALESIEQARKLDPLSAAVSSDAGLYRYFAGHWYEALRESVRTLKLEPGHLWARHCIALVLTHHNPWTAATWEREFGAPLDTILGVENADFAAFPAIYWKQRLENLQQIEQRGMTFNGSLAAVHMALGHQDQALRYLEQGIEQHLGWVIPFLYVHPLFQPLKGNPRFEAVLENVRW